METCLDEGTLQAYLDGELSPDALNAAASHISACTACAAQVRAAEQELALFSSAYAPAFNQSVPTERLRARLDEAIAELNTTAPRPFAPPHRAAASSVRAFFASVVASLTTFTPRQATAFASFLVAVAFAVVAFVFMQSPDNAPSPSQSIAKQNQPAATAGTVASGGNEQPDGVETAIQTTGETAGDSAPAKLNRRAPVSAGVQIVNARSPRAPRDAKVTPGANVATAAPKNEPVLEDEKTYLSSIASLTNAIEAQSAEGMTPTLRAEYERNLAVVNQAIVASRVAARRDPRDTDAKEFLRAAYQNKVELLSAVADQAQLASSRD